MPIVEAQLDRVIPYLRRGLGPRLRLVHRKHRGGSRHATERDGYFLLATLIVTRRARAVIPQQRKIEVAFVAVGPGNVHARARFHVNFHRGRFFALVNG